MSFSIYIELFENVVVIAFQSVFYSEKHKKYIFYFLKISFDINTSKWSKNTKKNINLK
jgi:hypothetical protein